MSEELFFVKNVKCGGCTSNIEKGLGDLENIETVSAEIEGGKVTVSGSNLNRATISEKLTQLGYPEA
jgi:copper chaperone CopZ